MGNDYKDIKFTDDDSLLATKNSAVEVALAMQEIGESDISMPPPLSTSILCLPLRYQTNVTSDVLALLDKGQRDAAIELKQKDLTKLKSLEPKDPTGVYSISFLSSSSPLFLRCFVSLAKIRFRYHQSVEGEDREVYCKHAKQG